eukprot:TRINITY_DN12994_c0_g11_i1.p1 TRINITY_DN12994_c0_g11~~TRINITY_DN12994_c0_g11_i1.p1  ORF type:complete len:372 (+),score=109.63 TRINITY_DN12994_c0_g11_i1:467-1582(+)
MPHGKTLREYLKSHPLKNIKEDVVMAIIKQVIEGLRACHAQGLVYGDLKLSNITLRKTPELSIRINNLGISALFAEVDGRNKKISKSPLYAAPEVKGVVTDMKSDIWSLGILCYILLSGNFPYVVTGMDSLDELRYQIENANFALRIPKDPDIQYVSDECRNFMIQTLENDPEKRPTANELSENPWMTMEFASGGTDENLKNIFHKILCATNNKKLFMSTFPITENLDTIKRNLKDIFDQIGSNDELSFKALKEALKESDILFHSLEIRRIFNKEKREDKEGIDYTEFENAALELCLLVNEKKLYLFFKECKIDHNGCLNKEIIKVHLAKNGLNDKEIALFLRDADNNRGERVLYADIVKMLRKIIIRSMK